MINPPPSPSSSANPSAIDWPQLNTMLPSKLAVLRILSSLLTLHQQTPAELANAFDNSAWGQVKDIAHKMRGTASLLAAPKLLSAAQAVEQHISETGAASAEMVSELKTRILDVLTEARHTLDSAPPV